MFNMASGEEFTDSGMESETNSQGNRLLAGFTNMERDQLIDRGERLRIPFGEVICEPGQPSRYVYFPITGILSSVISLNDGSAVETAMIGNEGLAGIPAIFNMRSTPVRVVGRLEGDALRVAVSDVHEILAGSPAARDLIGRYALTLFHQSAQNAACNLRHRLDQRMCRWLAATADRAARTEFRVTQEFLGEMLGVSRQSINTTAGTLHEKGLITYSRGRLAIADRARLEAAACECHEAARTAYHRLMHAA